MQYQIINLGKYIYEISINLIMTVNIKVPDNSIKDILDQFLPYSINAINSFDNYRDRVKLYSSVKNHKESVGVLFISEYNIHICFSPTIWIFGDTETSNEILEYLDTSNPAGKYVVQVTGKDANILKPGLHYKIFREYMMELNELNFHNYLNNTSFPIKRLDKNDARESLLISGFDLENKTEKSFIEMEEKFIAERETYGIFEGRKLICRGSIMSCNGKYCSVGGFITHNDFRNRGIGKFLVHYICGLVVSRHRIPVLFMRDDNIPASKLYADIGFEIKGNTYFMDHNTGSRP